MLEFYSKEIEITNIDGLDYSIVWIYPQTPPSYVSICFSFFYKTENGIEYNKNNIFRIESDKEGILSFCYNKDRIGNPEYYVRTAKDTYIRYSTINNKHTMLIIDKGINECFSPLLSYNIDSDDLIVKEFDNKFSITQTLLSRYKLYTYYDMLFLKKARVYIQKKKIHTLCYKKQIRNYLLCYQRKNNNIPIEILPCILKFISYI